MRRLESRSFSFAVQLQLEVADFQYQASILTRSALRLYLPPLAIEACAFARAFADLSRNFREKSPTFPTNTHRHTYTGLEH